MNLCCLKEKTKKKMFSPDQRQLGNAYEQAAEYQQQRQIIYQQHYDRECYVLWQVNNSALILWHQ